MNNPTVIKTDEGLVLSETFIKDLIPWLDDRADIVVLPMNVIHQETIEYDLPF